MAQSVTWPYVVIAAASGPNAASFTGRGLLSEPGRARDAKTSEILEVVDSRLLSQASGLRTPPRDEWHERRPRLTDFGFDNLYQPRPGTL